MSEDLVFKTTYSQPVETASAAGAGDGIVYKTRDLVETATTTDEPWWQWVDKRIEAADAAILDATGEVVGIERERHRRETEKMLEPLRRELAELKGQISTLVLLSGAKPSDLASAIEDLKTPGPRGPQGPAGPKGARGERGVTGPSIVGWALDRERFLAYPLMSHGRPGPALELRGLFERFLAETSSSGG